jgi:hypothetical protein
MFEFIYGIYIYLKQATVALPTLKPNAVWPQELAVQLMTAGATVVPLLEDASRTLTTIGSQP